MKKTASHVQLPRFRSFTGLLLLGTLLCSLAFASCNKNGEVALPTGSKVTAANYNMIHLGMTKDQVQAILGPPTNAETVDKIVFKRTTYRYEDGAKFVKVSFKNDELDEKDSNLGTQ